MDVTPVKFEKDAGVAGAGIPGRRMMEMRNLMRGNRRVTPELARPGDLSASHVTGREALVISEARPELCSVEGIMAGSRNSWELTALAAVYADV